MNSTRVQLRCRFARELLCACIGALLLVGCADSSSTSESVEEEVSTEARIPDPLTVVIVDAPELGPQIERQWRARRDGELTINDVSISDWQNRSDDDSIDADVILFPPGQLADLVSADQLLALPDRVWDSEDVSKRDFLKHLRQSNIEYDGQNWAVPLVSPQWMLMYRTDLLERTNVEVPSSWNQWAEAFAAIQDADLPDAVEERILLPLGEGWAAHSFLLRTAALIRQRGKLSTVFDRSNMKPLIAQEPFVESLKSLKELAGESSTVLTPTDVWKRMLDGRCAMAIGWPMSLDSDESSIDSEVTESIAVAPVPGSDRWYDLQAGNWFDRSSPDEQKRVDYVGFGGLIGAVLRDSRHASTGFDFLQWLCSRSIATSVLTGSQRSGPVRRSQLKSVSRWSDSLLSPSASESMADVIRTAHSNSVALVFPRIPGAHEYIQALDRHVRKCLEGNIAAESALESAAKDWDEITDRIGRKEQTANLRRVNGL